MAAAAETLQITNHENRLIEDVARRYFDTATAAAEVLDGSMHTAIPLGYDGRDIYSRKDGTRFGEMMQNSLDQAEKLYFENPNYQYEWRRRNKEVEELPLMMDMAAGVGPDTMVVVSDFPQELMDAPSDVGGYNVRRKQAMLRVITRHEDGTILLETQSLDGSNRQALEAIYAHFGAEPAPGELLDQRILFDLDDEEKRENLCSELTEIYDKSMSEQFGGKWHAGRRTQPGAHRINTYDFVQQQTDVLLAYIRSEDYGDPDLQYGLFQLLSERFNAAKFQRPEQFDDQDILWSIATRNEDYMLEEIHRAADRGRQQGIVFSACGGTVSGSKDPFGVPGQEPNDFLNAGYGNRVQELSWHGGSVKRGKCVSCKEDGKDVGVASWCKSCIKGHCGKK